MITTRIIEIQQEEGKTQRGFEFSIGKSTGYLNMLKTKGSVPGADVVLKIIAVYPKYTLNWLMLGSGPKYQTDVVNYKNRIETLETLLKSKDETIAVLKQKAGLKIV